MEVEPISPPIIAKKLWNIVRIVFHMIRKGIPKCKLILNLYMLLKRGKIAMTNVMLDHHHHHYAALTCRSNDVKMSFVMPREYEFSCSNTPVYHSKSKNCHHHHNRVEEINMVRRVLDMLNQYDMVELSPLTLPEFGVSPAVRPLRVTDSPFQLKDSTTEDYNHQVDKDAEEFIKKFYKDLKLEKRIDALESPSPYEY